MMSTFHRVPLTGPVAGVADDGQVAETLPQRDGVDVVGETSGGLVAADAALAEDDLTVSTQGQYGGMPCCPWQRPQSTRASSVAA